MSWEPWLKVIEVDNDRFRNVRKTRRLDVVVHHDGSRVRTGEIEQVGESSDRDGRGDSDSDGSSVGSDRR